MAYPGRPTMVPPSMSYLFSTSVPPPAMPPMTEHVIPPNLPPLNQPPPRLNFRNAATISSQPTVYNRVEQIQTEQVQPKGPVITVFVGNIGEGVSENLIKKILTCCGPVVNWKRVLTFGFCEYDGPMAGLRAVRLLHDLDIDGKKLVAKVDAKNKFLLDIYREEEIRNGTQKPETEREEDDIAIRIIKKTLVDCEKDSNGPPEETFLPFLVKTNLMDPALKRSKDKALVAAYLEDDKPDLISREIGKFRKTAEAEDSKKETEKDRKKKGEEKDKDLDRLADNRDDRREKVRERDKDRRKYRERSRSRSRSREGERYNNLKEDCKYLYRHSESESKYRNNRDDKYKDTKYDRKYY